MLLKVHQAMSAFELKREHTGQDIRDAIFSYIHIRDKTSVPTSADFKNCMKIIDFDGAIVNKMMSQMMWRSVNKKIDPTIIDEIKQYCQQAGLYSTMVKFGEGIIKQKMEARKEPGGRAIGHGW